MTAKMGRYRYWGDQKPDTSRPLLTFSRAQEAVAATARTGAVDQPSTTGTLRIYGPIDSWGGFWGVSAKEVAQALDLLGSADQIIVRVNSPGGESSEGRAIVNLLRAHKAEIVSVVDGGAYSAASYIAACGDDTVMSPGTTMMIHDTSTFVYGNAEALRKAADVVDILSDSGAELYAEIAGGTVEQWREKQRAETWYTAATAVEAGLMKRVATVPDAGVAETAGEDDPEVVDPSAVEERASASYDLSLFEKAPLGATPQPPSASAVGSVTPTQEGSAAVAFSDAQLTTMRQELGLPEDADEPTIVSALSEALAEQAEPPASSSPEIPEDHVVIPAARLADLEAGARAGTTVATRLHDQDREAFLDANRTKFAPANRAAWAKEFDRDEKGTREHFASAPEIVAFAEAGYGDATEENADDPFAGMTDQALEAFAASIGTTKEALRG